MEVRTEGVEAPTFNKLPPFMEKFVTIVFKLFKLNDPPAILMKELVRTSSPPTVRVPLLMVTKLASDGALNVGEPATTMVPPPSEADESINPPLR